MIIGFQPCLSEFYTRLVVSNSQKGRAITFVSKWLSNYLLITSSTSSSLNSHKASLGRYLVIKDSIYTSSDRKLSPALIAGLALDLVSSNC